MKTPAAFSLLRAAVVTAVVVAAQAVPASAAVSVPGNYGTVQAAINAVLNGSLPDGTTIEVSPGTYLEALSVTNTNRSFTVRGVGGANATVIDASGRGTAALFVSAATGRIVFRGLTFRNGAPAALVEGGGFRIRNSSPSLVDCVFESSSALNGGGGALFASNATFTGCVIRSNTARHFGGGLYIVQGSRPVFTNSDIVGNTSGTGGPDEARNGAGGGVFSHDSSPTFQGSRISGNASKFAAGGLFHMGVFGSPYGVSALVVEDSEIADNVTSQYSAPDNPAEGGGIHVEDNAVATVTRTRILRNRANTGGGLNLYRARYDVVDSIVEANVAVPAPGWPNSGVGGGIAATSNNPSAPLRPGSVVNLTRTLVRNNTATAAGGGIAVFGDNYSSVRASLSLASSVVSGNRSQSQGGGILVNRTDAVVSDSILVANAVTGGPYPSGGGMMITTASGATIAGTTIAQNTAAQYGGGIFIDNGSNLQMNGSRVYENAAAQYSGGGIFVGPGNTVGSVQNSIIADNTNYQIVDHACPATVLTYTNNTITPRPGLPDLYLNAVCSTTVTSISGFEQLSNTSGNNANVPRFAHFLSAPAAGTRFTLAWSVARATSVSISGTVVPSTGTLDVAPAASTSYTLSASTASGPIGPITVTVSVVQPPASTPVAATDGDFNGDGRADTTVFRPSNGTWYSRHSGAGTTSGFQWGNGNDVPVPADFDGDGRTDIAVFRPANGVWYIVYSSTGTAAGVHWGNTSDLTVPADYDGDGRADVAVFRPSDGVWYLRYSATGATAGFQWGNSLDRPVPGDYNGDGTADIAVFRPSNGVWYIRYSGTGATAGVQWGNGSDVAVPGDYDGDGRTDVAVFRPANGTWYIRHATGTTWGIQWGNSSDVAVPGDYDGDGRTDVAVFRPSNGVWYIRYSATGATSGVQWGNASDIPILKR